MEVLEPRPARVQAALVAIGDMLVASPLGPDGPRPSTWIGMVVQHVLAEDESVPADWRIWRVQRADGSSTETAKVPAEGWVWVHLPHGDLYASAA